MKQCKKLTVAMKKLLVKNGFEPKGFYYIKQNEKEVEFFNPEQNRKVVLQWNQ